MDLIWLGYQLSLTNFQWSSFCLYHLCWCLDKVKRKISDEVDTNWDNDITVKLTRRHLKVISNQVILTLSPTVSVSMVKTIFLVLCFVCSAAEILWVQILSTWVFVLLLCVFWWKNIPQSKLWLQQCFQPEGRIQFTLVDHLQRNMSFQIFYVHNLSSAVNVYLM